jgi:hypothetical protein
MKHTLTLLIALLLAPLAALRSADPPDTNYDESKVPSYTLPEALVCFDGQAVEDTKRWREIKGESHQLEKWLPLVLNKQRLENK